MNKRRHRERRPDEKEGIRWNVKNKEGACMLGNGPHGRKLGKSSRGIKKDQLVGSARIYSG